jgi:N-acyl-D-aspartate/D-glutamate deacylase
METATLTHRALLLTLAAIALQACSPDEAAAPNEVARHDSPADAPSGAYDWLIAGGTVVDGTGEPAYRAHVLVRDGRIAFVGSMDPEAVEVRERYDATGLVVAPGFIDAHAHGDPIEDPAFPNFLAMGVTTIMLGQDGGSPEVETLSEQLDAVDAARPAVNVAYLVGHNTIRRESGVGFDQPGTEGLVRMSELVAEGLAAGAFGLSTGLEYDPGSRSGPGELAAIAEPVARVGGVVISHMRSEDADRVEDALRELIEQGRQSGARVHASHLKIVLGSDTTLVDSLLAVMAKAREEGIAITSDVYPYTASYTGIGILFPEWARAPNDYEAVVRDRREELAEHLRKRVRSRNGPDATLFGTGDWSGRTLAEVAAELSRPFEDVLIELGPDGASAAYFVMSENVMSSLLNDPHAVVSSDGSPTMQHPRGYGSFARVIRRYVVEDERFSLEEAVRKMSGATAAIYRMDDAGIVEVPRGLVREGFAADLLVFDPAEVRDVADFERPHRLAEGMRAVWVNGQPAWRAAATVSGPGKGHALRARW